MGGGSGISNRTLTTNTCPQATGSTLSRWTHVNPTTDALCSCPPYTPLDTTVTRRIRMHGLAYLSPILTVQMQSASLWLQSWHPCQLLLSTAQIRVHPLGFATHSYKSQGVSHWSSLGGFSSDRVSPDAQFTVPSVEIYTTALMFLSICSLLGHLARVTAHAYWIHHKTLQALFTNTNTFPNFFASFSCSDTPVKVTNLPCLSVYNVLSHPEFPWVTSSCCSSPRTPTPNLLPDLPEGKWKD